MLTLYVKSCFINAIYLQKMITFIHTILCLILYNTYNYSIKSWCSLTPQYIQKEKNIIYVTRHDVWCWFQSISYTAQSFKQNVIAACKGIVEKGSEWDNIKKESSRGSPFVISWKHMTSTCSVSCSEFFITVTVSMSRQTQQIACAKVSMPRFHRELNRSKCMQSKKHMGRYSISLWLRWLSCPQSLQ